MKNIKHLLKLDKTKKIKNLASKKKKAILICFFILLGQPLKSQAGTYFFVFIANISCHFSYFENLTITRLKLKKE